MNPSHPCVRGASSPAGAVMRPMQRFRGLPALLLLMFALSVLQAAPAFAQRITGKVSDATGTVLPGVSISIKGTSQGTVSTATGDFAITVPNSQAVLLFSFVGYEPQEIAVGSRTKIDVVLQSSAKGLNELVVVGYGQQKKATLTGALTAVKAADIQNIAPSNLSNSLAGRAPGVNVTNTSGLSGASSSVRIRGSFGDPLYVIDGVVRDKTDFDALEAAEVDQMTFLKDAAASSVYGARAGNGVVLVTTKKGSLQKPTFNFQTNYTTMRPTRKLLSDQTTATDELIYQNRVAGFLGTTPPNGPEEFDYFRNRSYNVHDFIWQNPYSHRHTLSVSGGSEKITYYSMLSYRGEEGSYKNLDHGKFNLRTNVTAKISEAVKIGLNVAASQQNLDRFYWPFTGDDDFDVSDLYRVTFNWPKTYPFYTLADGTPTNYPTEFPVQTPMGSWQAWSVIDQVIGNRYIKTRNRELNSILTLDVSLDKYVKGLSTKVVGNYVGEDYMRKKFLTYQKNYVFNQADPDGNRYLPAPPDPNKTNIFTFSQNQEFLNYEIRTGWSYQLNWFLNYNRTFGKHGIDAVAVFEQAENGGIGATARLENPITPLDVPLPYSSDRQFKNALADEWLGSRRSWIGRANYNYDQRYIAEFSFRYDGNPQFPQHSRWGFFPSVSAAWRISEEPWFKNMTNKLDDLKLRASYGTTGTDIATGSLVGISDFGYLTRYINGNTYMFGNALYQGIAPGDVPNFDLTWATNKNYNIGVDVVTFNNRLTGTLDLFLRKEVDILGTRLVRLPHNYGQALAPENYAARSWRGGELFLEWRDKAAGNKINYSVTANVGYARDRWDIYDEEPSFAPGGNRNYESRIGRPNDRIIGLKAIGMVRTQEQLDALMAKGFKQFGRNPYLGALIFEDVRGDGYAPGADGKIDDNDNQLLSENATPRINFGIGLNISYKNFALQSLFQGVSGYDRIISNQEGPGMRQHGGSIRPYYPIWAGDVWTVENPNGKYPRPVGSNWFESGTGASSFWIRNGAYLRLKMLNLGYTLPKSWLNAIGLSSGQIYFNGTNLFAISDMLEFHDPEQKNYDSYPVMKTFTIGADIKF
ncbi:SusC/RagA family TonB-linked outer membrane protein [Chitinophaga lutea]